MDILEALDERAEECLRRKIRIDCETNQLSVIDLVVVVTGSEPSDAGKTLARLGVEFLAKCPKLRINGSGRLTPVADARTSIEIIWALPGKAAKEFRRQSAHNVCRMLGADMSLAREIEARSLTIPQEQKDFFLGPQATTVATYKRKTLKLGDAEFEVPNDDDPQVLKDRLWGLIDRAGELQLLASQRGFDAEHERRMVVLNAESEHRLALSRKSHQKELEEMDRDLETGRTNHKRVMDEFAIQNCQLVAKRTKAVKHVLETLEECKMIHPSLMTAAMGSLSNMAAQAAGVGQQSVEEQSHLEDFSTMAGKLFNRVLSLSHLSTIGKRVAAEYRKRYNGQKPQQIKKQVNADMRDVNVYHSKDREWIEGILRTYVENIPRTSSE
jgi:hypothetical protein